MHKILRLASVTERTGIPKSTLYELIAAGDFPKQISLSQRSVGWLETEIDHWLETKITARRTLTVKQTTENELEV